MDEDTSETARRIVREALEETARSMNMTPEQALELMARPHVERYRKQQAVAAIPVVYDDHISIRAYFRSMWAIVWGAFRHPTTTTVVNLRTGESREV